MKKWIVLFLLLIPSLSQAQTTEKNYYLYNIVIFKGNLEGGIFSANIDNGVKVKKICDENGNKIKFKTPAGVLMYLISQGWEIYANSSHAVGAMGISTSYPYCVIRKPCTKEEFEKALEEAVEKKEK